MKWTADWNILTDLSILIGNFDCGFSHFPATLILREINFGCFQKVKNCHLNYFGSFHCNFWWILHLKMSRISKKSNSELLKWSKWQFFGLQYDENWFHVKFRNFHTKLLSNTIISVHLIETIETRKFNFTKNVNFQQIILFMIDMITTKIIIFSIPFKSHLVKNFSSKFYYKRNSCIWHLCKSYYVEFLTLYFYQWIFKFYHLDIKLPHCKNYKINYYRFFLAICLSTKIT